MSKIAVITARGGSKRIPKKNIKEFCGKPIIEYSVNAAVKSGIFDTVMVSTDSREIADVASACGAEVPFYRSEKTSNDYATTADVISEVLEEYGKLGKKYEYLCCIYPTAPFLTAERLSAGMKALEESGADSAVPVVKFGFPPQRAVIIEDGLLKFKWPEYAMARSQDLESFYHDAGQFYCLKVESFISQRKLIMGKTVPIVLPELEVQDIDNVEDWEIAEVKYRLLHR